MKSTNDWPKFRSKAHEASLACRFLSDYVRENRRPGDAMLFTCLHGHSRMNDIMATSGQTFTPEQAASFKSAGYVCLQAWVQLAVQNAGRNRFQIKPKHHLLEHGLNHACATFRNPRSHWLYRHESFVGTTARISARCHVSTATRRTLQRWMLTWHVAAPHHELRPHRGVKRKHHRLLRRMVRARE